MRPTVLLTVIAATAVGACGGEDRLTREEYGAKLQPAVDEISRGFGAVYAEIGGAEGSDRVPAAALRRLSDAAATERRIVEEVARLEPPEDLEDPADRFVAGARRQADDFERLARSEEPVTVAEVAAVIEEGASVEPLRELGRHGVVQPPGR